MLRPKAHQLCRELREKPSKVPTLVLNHSFPQNYRKWLFPHEAGPVSYKPANVLWLGLHCLQGWSVGIGEWSPRIWTICHKVLGFECRGKRGSRVWLRWWEGSPTISTLKGVPRGVRSAQRLFQDACGLLISLCALTLLLLEYVTIQCPGNHNNSHENYHLYNAIHCKSTILYP
jgi:hypothetical protein